MKHKGFTLIELLVVISIIGILATLIINNLNDARTRARDSKRKSEVTQLKTGLRLYYNDNQSFPLAADLTASGEFAVGDTIYMQQLPEEFTYTSTGGDTYSLKTTLENASDPDLIKTQTACLPAPDGTLDYYICEN